MTAPAPIGVIAHYNLLEMLEPSGPGDLFRARDTRAGRTVTIRLLPAAYSADGGRLMTAARAVCSLSHPNVSALYDVGEHDGRIYLAFEFLNGRTLRAEMAGHAMNVRRAVDITIQIADAIAAAHAAGFVHGGLSPDSILVTAKGHAKIPAFELASRAGFDTREGGLRDYESPEEMRGQAADDRSDVYSAGAVLYEMLTTRRPVPRGAAAPSASNPHVPHALDAAVLKAVAPNPERRYQSAAAFAADLREAAAALTTRGQEEGNAAGTSGVHLGRVLVLSAAALLVIALAAWFLLRGSS